MTVSIDADRVPDFFIVGHPKSGTTALYEMLRRHPQVFMPELKEPRFLAGDMYVHSAAASELPATMDQYLALFAQARADQLAGEASPLYLASAVAAASIAELQPEARIIAVLREPASFLRSLHLQFVQSHIEDKNDLAQAIALESVRREGRQIPPSSRLRPQVLQYSDHVRYVEQLRRYHDLFPAERVLVLIYDDFRSDNEETVKKVLRFLDIDDAAQIDTTEANPTVRVRSQQLDHLLHSISMGRGPASSAVKRTVKSLTPRRLRRHALKATQQHLVYGKPQPPDEEIVLELRSRFKGEVAALSDYLARDLTTLWGYDGV
jgi:hypothetical protein